AEDRTGTETLTRARNDAAGTCGAVTDTMVITINAPATANAGLDQTACASSPTVTLAGTVGGAASSGSWSGGAGTFTPNNTTLNRSEERRVGKDTTWTATLTLSR